MEEEETQKASQQASEAASQPPVAPQTPVQSSGGAEETLVLPEQPEGPTETASTPVAEVPEQSPADMQQATAPQTEQSMAPAVPQPGQSAEPAVPQAGQSAELEIPVPSQAPPAEEEAKQPGEESSEQTQ